MMPVRMRDGVRRLVQPLLLLVGLVFLILVGAGSILLVSQAQDDAERVIRTLEAQNKLSTLRLLIRRAESGQRGYLLTSDPEFLISYRDSIDAVMPAFAELKRAMADNATQQAMLVVLEPTLTRKLNVLRETVRLNDAGEKERALEIVRSKEGLALMEDITAVVERINGEEQRLLTLRSENSKLTNRALLAINLVGAVVIIVIAGISLLLVRRSNRQRDAAEQALEDANAGLEAAVAERTEHLRRANEEIRHSAQVLNNTLDSMADALLVADEYGRVILSNPASHRLLGYSPAEMQDLAQHNRLLEPDGVTPFPEASGPLTRAIRGEPTDDVEFIIRIGGRKDLHVIANSRPLRDADGALKGAVAIYRDITTVRETERQLQHAHKMEAIGQLTGGMAHDFNNILTVIIGLTGVLAESVAENPELAATTHMIDEAAERGAQLIANLLAFARKQPLQPRPIDINDLVVNAGKLLRPVLGEQVEIAVLPESDAWPALVDSSQLTNALLNLAINARDAMPDGGKLTIETGNVFLDEAYAQAHSEVRAGPYVMIAVSDTGTGIPKADLDRVFEPFFTTKKMEKGTGLGLSMVFGFVKQSNGHIKVYSEEGDGTTIKIYLPRANADSGEVTSHMTDATFTGGSETILVVEDDMLVRDYVTAQLKSLGYATHSFATAAGALSFVDSEGKFDLLLTDVILAGGMNGRQLADEVIKRRPTTKVLYTSGYTENAIVHHGRLDAGVLLLAKPYRKSDLARTVRLALSASRPGVSVATEARPYAAMAG